MIFSTQWLQVRGGGDLIFVRLGLSVVIFAFSGGRAAGATPPERFF